MFRALHSIDSWHSIFYHFKAILITDKNHQVYEVRRTEFSENAFSFPEQNVFRSTDFVFSMIWTHLIVRHTSVCSDALDCCCLLVSFTILLKVVLKQNLWPENIRAGRIQRAFGNQIVGKTRKHFKYIEIFRKRNTHAVNNNVC